MTVALPAQAHAPILPLQVTPGDLFQGAPRTLHVCDCCVSPMPRDSGCAAFRSARSPLAARSGDGERAAGEERGRTKGVRTEPGRAEALRQAPDAAAPGKARRGRRGEVAASAPESVLALRCGAGSGRYRKGAPAHRVRRSAPGGREVCPASRRRSRAARGLRKNHRSETGEPLSVGTSHRPRSTGTATADLLRVDRRTRHSSTGARYVVEATSKRVVLA